MIQVTGTHTDPIGTPIAAKEIRDATYKGELLAGTDKLADIRTYRGDLRNYKYATSDPRPEVPVWFT